MTTQDFIFDTPLYQWVKEDTDVIVQQLRYPSIGANEPLFEGYNPSRKVDSTYQVYQGLETRHNIEIRFGEIHDQVWYDDNIWYVTLECKRYGGKCFPKDVNAFAQMTAGTPLGKLLENLHDLNVHFRGFEEHI